jgi:hypothetical protein
MKVTALHGDFELQQLRKFIYAEYPTVYTQSVQLYAEDAIRVENYIGDEETLFESLRKVEPQSTGPKFFIDSHGETFFFLEPFFYQNNDKKGVIFYYEGDIIRTIYLFDFKAAKKYLEDIAYEKVKDAFAILK